MGLLRYQVFLSYGLLFVSLWYYSWIRQEEWSLSTGIAQTIIPYAPFLALLLLASYLLTRLIIGVLSFRDCPDAATELEKQIKEAKAAMKKLNVIE